MIRSRSVAYHFTVFIHLLDKGNIFRIFQDLFSSFKPNTERNSIRIIATQTESYTNAASTYYSSVLQFLIMCFTRREKKQSLLYANLVWFSRFHLAKRHVLNCQAAIPFKIFHSTLKTTPDWKCDCFMPFISLIETVISSQNLYRQHLIENVTDCFIPFMIW
jgi:hypothetical protein